MQEAIWYDRKRIFGLPISFTRYRIYDDKLVHSKGLLTVSEGEILLYRVLDVELRLTLFNRIFGVGTIVLYTGDVTDRDFRILNVKNPRKVLEIVNTHVERERSRLGVKGRELYIKSFMRCVGAYKGIVNIYLDFFCFWVKIASSRNCISI